VVEPTARTCQEATKIKEAEPPYLYVFTLVSGKKMEQFSGLYEGRQREQQEAQADGRGIQGADGIAQIDAEVVIAIQLRCTLSRKRRHIRPVAPLVSVG